jgi:hypothetical protein
MHSVTRGDMRTMGGAYAHFLHILLQNGPVLELLALRRCIPSVSGGRTLMQVGASAMATLCTLPTTLRTYWRATAATASSEWGSYANWNAMLNTDFQHWVESSPLRNGSIAWESRLF